MTPTVNVEGRELKLSNLDKVLYPAVGFTKGEVIDYYSRIAPVLLPHVRDRPLTLLRYPEGVEADHFYEKQCPSHRPPWVRTVEVPSERSASKKINYCLADDLPTLVWLANLASLEVHPLLAHAGDVTRPASVVFDLDPGPPADVVACARVALVLREVLDDLGLASCPKTSGKKGMQMHVPLNTPVTYDRTKPFAHAVAQLLEKQQPKDVVSRMDKAVRKGKVFIDWSQNDEHKTTVAVYSLRARERPAVSTPLTWDEVEEAAATGDASRLDFDAAAVLARVDDRGDLYAPVAELEQDLPASPR